jgi:hypothetical protein
MTFDERVRADMEQQKRRIEAELSRQMFAHVTLRDGMAFAPRPAPSLWERLRRRAVPYALGWKEALRGVWMAALGRFDYMREDEWS